MESTTTTTTPQSDQTMTNVRDIQSKAQEALQQAGRRWNDAVSTVSTRAKEASRVAEQQIQQNPWTAIGIGFGAGVVMGALLMLAANPRR
jgi:ElaB/YqjD/DUF883 family membrane-anchored ribosome-binding protein